MKNIVSIFILLLAYSVPGTAQWTNIGSSPKHSFRDMSFPTAKDGYAIGVLLNRGKRTIYRTVDGGRNWTEMYLNQSLFDSVSIQAISFVSASTGVALVIKGSTNKIYKTTSYGKQWLDITPDSINYHPGQVDIQFVDHAIIKAAIGRMLFSSNDAGKTWTRQYFGALGEIMELHFRNSREGLIGLWDGTFLYSGTILTTITGGQTFDTLSLNYYQSAVGNVKASKHHLFAMTNYRFGMGQTLYRSSNMGKSWDSLALNFMVDSFDIATDLVVENDTTLYISTQEGAIYKSNDTGNSWKLVHQETFGLYNMAATWKNVYAAGDINVLVAKFEPQSDSLHCNRYKIINLKDSISFGNPGVYFEMTTDSTVRYNTGYIDLYFLDQNLDTITQYNLWGSYIPYAGDTTKYFFDYIGGRSTFPNNFNGHLIMRNPECFVPYKHQSTNLKQWLSEPMVKVYPNPVGSVLNISSEKPIRNTRITNANGQVVKPETTINDGINTSNLTSGVYFIEIWFEDGTNTYTHFIKSQH